MSSNNNLLLTPPTPASSGSGAGSGGSRRSRRNNTTAAAAAVPAPVSNNINQLSSGRSRDGNGVQSPVYITPRSVSSPNQIPPTPSAAGAGTGTGAAPPIPSRSELGQRQRRYLPIVQTPKSSSSPNMGTDRTEMVDDNNNGIAGSSPNNIIGESTEIWGTTVHVSACELAFDRFFDGFIEGETNQPLYHRLLSEAIETGSWFINLNCNNLYSFDPELYRLLVIYPAEIIPIFDTIIDRKRLQLFKPTDIELQQWQLNPNSRRYIQIRPFNLLSSRNTREIDPADIDSLVAVKGMVIRVTNVIPEMKTAYFKCLNCSHGNTVLIEDGIINEPIECLNRQCSSKRSYQLIHNRCSFEDKQIVRLQETPDSIPEGQTPHSIGIYCFGDLVDTVKPGDRVEVTGLVKAAPKKVNPRKSTLSAVYDNFIDAIHFKKADLRRLQLDLDENTAESELNQSIMSASLPGTADIDDIKSVIEARERKLKALGNDPNIYNRLVKSIAPSIWEMDDVKKGILCMLFGGSTAEAGAASGRFRGEINVLMCGDPGTSKSQLLQYVHKLAPRGIYTSGKGSSAVGLTASVTKDPITREMVLESGALVLSDRGICCIDEFDKMSDSTRSILHEVMEQQTVSIAKAGIVCTLNARTSILASANPKESRYNPNLSVVENIQIMPTLLSRFDLIYLILDQPNEKKDRQLAKHLVSLYYDQPATAALNNNYNSPDIIPIETLTQYISYARRTIKPKLTDIAESELIKGYAELRNIGHQSTNKVVTATPRQLEALIRLSESLARMRLSELVEECDVNEARRLMAVATQSAATDPVTGKIDMDLLTTGHSTTDRNRSEEQLNALKAVIQSITAKQIAISKLLIDFNAQSDSKISAEILRGLLQKLQAEQFITFPNQNTIKKS